jgi:hypothetical protein
MLCVEKEESIIALLNEELDIDSDDQMDLENVEETPSEELSDEVSESESESETSVLHVGGWEDMTMGGKKPNPHTFTKNAGPQYNLLPLSTLDVIHHYTEGNMSSCIVLVSTHFAFEFMPLLHQLFE